MITKKDIEEIRLSLDTANPEELKQSCGMLLEYIDGQSYTGAVESIIEYHMAKALSGRRDRSNHG